MLPATEPDRTARDKSCTRKQVSDPIQLGGTYESGVRNAVMSTLVDGRLALPGPMPRVTDCTRPGHYT